MSNSGRPLVRISDVRRRSGVVPDNSRVSERPSDVGCLPKERPFRAVSVFEGI